MTEASSECPICGVNTPHVHTRRSIAQEARLAKLREGFEHAIDGWWPRLKAYCHGSYGRAVTLTYKKSGYHQAEGPNDEYVWGPVQLLWEVYQRVPAWEIPSLPDEGIPDINEALQIQKTPWSPVAEPASLGAEAAVKEMEARKDAAYLERNQVVSALAKCFPSGVAKTAIEGWSEDWHGCVYIDLPTGQASWHYHDSHAHLFSGLPLYTKPWDGHTTDEKYQRLAAMQHQPIKAGWVKCSEKMPECDKRDRSFGVEVLVHPHSERTAYYGCRQTKEPNFYKYGTVLTGITHWAPLPPPPSEPTGGEHEQG